MTDGEQKRKSTKASVNPVPFSIHSQVTNPIGLLLIGRDNELSTEQKLDFEVIRRHYKNVVDIITYNDLLRRLNFKIRALSEISTEASRD